MARRDWTASPDAVYLFANYCAPTALAALAGVSTVEAAKWLLATPGMTRGAQGSVSTFAWRDLLKSLGGRLVLAPVPPDARANWLAARYQRGSRSTWTACHRYTVAQYLRENPTGAIVLSVNGHTLFARDGQVVADTKNSKSLRARVQWAAHFEGA